MTEPIVGFYNRQRKLTVTKQLDELLLCCVAAALECEGLGDRLCEVDITFVSSRKIRELNRQFRQVDRETDVLSFPLGDGDYETDPENGAVSLGDIVISLEKAYDQAREYGHSFEREVGFLTVHSMLHLLGYDHIDEDEGDVMREHEKIILERIGLTR